MIVANSLTKVYGLKAPKTDLSFSISLLRISAARNGLGFSEPTFNLGSYWSGFWGSGFITGA